MTTHREGPIASRDGTALQYEQWLPGAQAWTSLVIVPGRGEHTGRYAATAEAFAAEGVIVWAVDLRGQGRSAGRRGHVQSLRDVLQDVEAALALAAQAIPHQRPVLLGHSMGGLIALHYAVEHPAALAGLIVSSPLCGLSAPVAAWEAWVASRVFNRWWPTFTFHRTKRDAQFLSHDPRIKALFLNDPLVHFRVTARLFMELTHAMNRLPLLVQQLTVPTLVLQAGDDHVVSAEATRHVFEAIGAPDKQLILYDGFYHELFNEVEAARVVCDVVGWLRTHCP